MPSFIPCTSRLLRPELRATAKKRALEARPDNELAHPGPATDLTLFAHRRWHARGVHLTVQFLDGPSRLLIERILLHMNSWGHTADVTFVHTEDVGDVRIARVPDDGHWSLVGTDVLVEHENHPTMNLDGFTMSTSEAELRRVVRHQTGHTLGIPHESLRRDVIERIDHARAIRYFDRECGWEPDHVRTRLLAPLEDHSIIGRTHHEEVSVMTYQLPGEIMTDRKPMIGGIDITEFDREFIATIYPKPPRRTSNPHQHTHQGHHAMTSATDREEHHQDHEHHHHDDEHHQSEHHGTVSHCRGGVLYFTRSVAPAYVVSVVSELERRS